MEITAAVATGTITSNVGIILDPGTAGGTSNVDLLIGTTTIPSGSWSIYNTNTNPSYFAGQIRLGNPTADTTDNFSISLASNVQVSFAIGTGTGAAAVAKSAWTTGTANSYVIFQINDNTGSPFAQISCGSGVGNLQFSMGANLALVLNSSGVVKFGSPSFTANGSVATAMSSLGPTGSHATIQEWLTIQDSGGTVRYIPCF